MRTVYSSVCVSPMWEVTTESVSVTPLPVQSMEPMLGPWKFHLPFLCLSRPDDAGLKSALFPLTIPSGMHDVTHRPSMCAYLLLIRPDNVLLLTRKDSPVGIVAKIGE